MKRERFFILYITSRPFLGPPPYKIFRTLEHLVTFPRTGESSEKGREVAFLVIFQRHLFANFSQLLDIHRLEGII